MSTFYVKITEKSLLRGLETGDPIFEDGRLWRLRELDFQKHEQGTCQRLVLALLFFDKYFACIQVIEVR